MHPRYLEAWEISPIISLWPWLYHFPYDEFVLIFKVFLCLSNGTIVFFFSLFKKKSYLLYLPFALLPLHPSLPCEQGSPWPHTPAKLFCCLSFLWTDLKLLLPWIFFFKINFVMVLKKEIKMHCCIKLFLIKENYGKKIGNTSKLYVDKF